MMSLNRAQILGNMTRDPELRNTTTGKSVCSFGVATNYSYTDAAGQKQEQVEFHNVVAWGKLAEICSQYLGKGRKVFIEGRIQSREWDGQDGQKRRTTEIVAENMIMLDRAPAGQGQAQGGAYGAGAAPAPRPAAGAPVGQGEPPIPVISYDEPGTATAPGMTEEEIKVEDIPF